MDMPVLIVDFSENVILIIDFEEMAACEKFIEMYNDTAWYLLIGT